LIDDFENIQKLQNPYESSRVPFTWF